MADLDTRSKRASSWRLLLPFVLALPLADGTLSQADQQHTVCDYSGILATASSSPNVSPDVLVLVPVDDYFVRCPVDDVVCLVPPDTLVRAPVDDVGVAIPQDETVRV